MAYAHLINCLLLSYGPIFVIYRAKNLSDYRAFFTCAFAGLAFLLTSTCKMIILASLLSSSQESETENSKADITSVQSLIRDFFLYKASFKELRQNLFNLIDFCGMYFMLRYKMSFIDDLPCRILAIALGWSFVESLCRSFFYFILNASGDEFTFAFIMKAIFNNLELFENIAMVAMVIFLNKEFRGHKNSIQGSLTNKVSLILMLIFLKASVFPTILSYLKPNYLENLDETILFAKAGFTSFLILFANNQQVF